MRKKTARPKPLTIVRAQSWRARTIGLIGRRHLDDDEGMLFDRCAGVHTFFMRMPIDVVFLDAERRVMRALRCVPPWRPLVACAGARAVLELRSGTIERRGIARGTHLMLATAREA